MGVTALPSPARLRVIGAITMRLRRVEGPSSKGVKRVGCCASASVIALSPWFNRAESFLDRKCTYEPSRQKKGRLGRSGQPLDETRKVGAFGFGQPGKDLAFGFRESAH